MCISIFIEVWHGFFLLALVQFLPAVLCLILLIKTRDISFPDCRTTLFYISLSATHSYTFYSQNSSSALSSLPLISILFNHRLHSRSFLLIYIFSIHLPRLNFFPQFLYGGRTLDILSTTSIAKVWPCWH